MIDIFSDWLGRKVVMQGKAKEGMDCILVTVMILGTREGTEKTQRTRIHLRTHISPS